MTMRGGGTTAMATAGAGEGCAVCGDLDGGWGRGAGGGSGACMHGECSELTLGTFTGMAILLLSIYVETMQHLLLPNSPGPAATCTLHTACAAHTVPSAHPPTATLLWRVCACMHQLPSSPLSHPPTQPTTIQSPSSHLHTHLPITHSPPPLSPLSRLAPPGRTVTTRRRSSRTRRTRWRRWLRRRRRRPSWRRWVMGEGGTWVRLGVV